MSNKNPKLEFHADFWKFDLPSPNDRPENPIESDMLYTTPNALNTIYLEFPTSTLKARSLSALLSALLLAVNIAFIPISIYFLFMTPGKIEIELALIYFAILTSPYWSSLPMIRMDFELPQDQPIRFNRLRRKVYVYRYHYDWFNPLSKTKWGVRPAAYNWDDLHAEASGLYIPTKGRIERITLCALKPGTLEVIDRFHFADDIYFGEHYWAMIRLYMQQGPEALPPFPYEPRDWEADPRLSLGSKSPMAG